VLPLRQKCQPRPGSALAVGPLAPSVSLAISRCVTLGESIGSPSETFTRPWIGRGTDNVAKFVLLVLTSVVQGLAFGLLFLNSSAAIVTYFVMAAVFSLVASLWSGLEKVQPWIDLWTSQQPLFDGSDLSGQEWAQLGASTLLWVVLPFAAGLLRVLRAEVK
jgi:ABC-2 type transport system permease protein